MKRIYNPLDATQEADNIIEGKDPLYAGRWRNYEPVSLADVAVAKCQLVKRAILLQDLDTALRESLDAINYLRFLWSKLKEEKDEREIAQPQRGEMLR